MQSSVPVSCRGTHLLLLPGPLSVGLLLLLCMFLLCPSLLLLPLLFKPGLLFLLLFLAGHYRGASSPLRLALCAGLHVVVYTSAIASCKTFANHTGPGSILSCMASSRSKGAMVHDRLWLGCIVSAGKFRLVLATTVAHPVCTCPTSDCNGKDQNGAPCIHWEQASAVHGGLAAAV